MNKRDMVVLKGFGMFDTNPNILTFFLGIALGRCKRCRDNYWPKQIKAYTGPYKTWPRMVEQNHMAYTLPIFMLWDEGYPLPLTCYLYCHVSNLKSMCIIISQTSIGCFELVIIITNMFPLSLLFFVFPIS